MASSPDVTTVDAAILRAGGHRIRTSASDASTSFQAHHRRIEDALSGWSPTARAAMAETVDSWRRVSSELTTSVDGHGERMQVAGRRYTAVDATNATGLDAATVD